MLTKCSTDDFWLLKVVRKRNGGKCLLARIKNGNSLCRLRIYKKKYVDEERCRAEMQRFADYQHPFLEKVIGQFENVKKLFLVTEDAEGRSMFELIIKAGKLNEKQ